MQTSSSKRGVDWPRILRFLMVLGFCGWLGFTFGETALTNEIIVDVMVNSVSIFSGVLLVVVGILGEPNLVLGGKWSVKLEWFKETHRKVLRYNLVFASYLLTLLSLVSALLGDVKSGEIVGIWFARVAFGLFLASVIWSFPLPWALAKIQRDRAEQLFKPRSQNDHTSSGTETE